MGGDAPPWLVDPATARRYATNLLWSPRKHVEGSPEQCFSTGGSRPRRSGLRSCFDWVLWAVSLKKTKKNQQKTQQTHNSIQ